MQRMDSLQAWQCLYICSSSTLSSDEQQAGRLRIETNGPLDYDDDIVIALACLEEDPDLKIYFTLHVMSSMMMKKRRGEGD